MCLIQLWSKAENALSKRPKSPEMRKPDAIPPNTKCPFKPGISIDYKECIREAVWGADTEQEGEVGVVS